MTEEIIIFEQDGNIVGITKEGKYFESYKTTENVAILRGAGLYIKRLEQEIKELSFAIEKCLENAGIECDDEEQALRNLPMLGNAHYKVLVEKEALEQENKKLKKDVQLFKCLDTFGENECHCAYRCLGNEFCEDADKKINKYRSALEDIKTEANKFDYWNNNLTDASNVINSIKEKINEVLNDN